MINKIKKFNQSHPYLLWTILFIVLFMVFAIVLIYNEQWGSLLSRWIVWLYALWIVFYLYDRTFYFVIDTSQKSNNPHKINILYNI